MMVKLALKPEVHLKERLFVTTDGKKDPRMKTYTRTH